MLQRGALLMLLLVRYVRWSEAEPGVPGVL